MSDTTPEAPRGLDARLPRAELEAVYAAEFRRADEEGWARRLFEKDATLWSADPIVQEKIAARLGWLDAPTHFTDRIAGLEAFGDGIRDAGFTTAVVAGMGGSSLAPWVLGRVFSDIADWLEIRVLDSTDPEAVVSILGSTDPERTLVIVGSKSGTTTETLAFLAYGWDRVRRALHPDHRDATGIAMLKEKQGDGESGNKDKTKNNQQKPFLSGAGFVRHCSGREGIAISIHVSGLVVQDIKL